MLSHDHFLQAKMEAQKSREDAESFQKEAEALRKQAQPGPGE